MSKLAPLSFSAPIGKTVSGEDVRISDHFYKWLAVQLFTRVGGQSAQTNDELDQLAQYDIREAEGAELSKRIDVLAVDLAVVPDYSAEIARINALIADLQVIVNTFDNASNAEVQKRMADEARNTVLSLSQEATTEQLLKLYHGIVGG